MEHAMIAHVLCSLLLAVQSAPLHHRTLLPLVPDLYLQMSSSGDETRLQETRRGGDLNHPTQQEGRRNSAAGAVGAAVAEEGVWPSRHSLDLEFKEERLPSHNGQKLHAIDQRSPETVLGSSTINASGGRSSTDSSQDWRSQDENISDVKRSGNSQGLGHRGARPVFLHQPDDDLVARHDDNEPPDRIRVNSIPDLLPTYHRRDGALASSNQPGVSTSRQIPTSVITHGTTQQLPQQLLPTETMAPASNHLMSARSTLSTHTASTVDDQRVFFVHETLVTNPSPGPHSAIVPVPVVTPPASHLKTSLSTSSTSTTPDTLPTPAAPATSSTTSDATDPVLTRVSQYPAFSRDISTFTFTTSSSSTNALNDVSGRDHSPGWEGETPTPPYFVSSESEALHSAILGVRDHTNGLSSPASNARGDNNLVSKARVTRSAELSPLETGPTFLMSPALTTVTSMTPSPSAAVSSVGVNMSAEFIMTSQPPASVTSSFPSEGSSPLARSEDQTYPSSWRQPLSETNDVTVVTEAPVKDDTKTVATSASSTSLGVEAEHHDVVPATETVVLLPTESHSIVLQANTSSPSTSARTTLSTTRSPSTTRNSSPPSEPVTSNTTKRDIPKQSAVGQSESFPTGRLETAELSTWWPSPTLRAVDVSRKYNSDFRHLSPSGPTPSTTSRLLISVPTEMAGSGSGTEALLDTNPDDISMATRKEGDAVLPGTQSGDGMDVTVHSHSEILGAHTTTPAGTSVSTSSSDDNRMVDWGVADSSMRAAHSSRTAGPVFTITNYVDNSPGDGNTGNNRHVTSGVTASSHATDSKDQLTSVPPEALDTASSTTPAVDGQTMWSPPPSSPTPGLLMVVQVQLQMTWTEFCHSRPAFYLELVEILRQDGQQSHVSVDQIRLMDQEGVKCARQQGETSSQQQEEISGLQQGAAAIVVRLYLVNKSERYDSYLTVVCAQVMKQGFLVRDTSFFKNKLVDVQLQQLPVPDPALASPATYGDDTEPMKENNGDKTDELINEPGVTIAVVIAAVGGACCVTLIVMQVVLRRRYRRDLRRMVVSRSYSVSSVDSIALASVSKSRPSSGLFNPALDVTPDQAKPSHVLGATELINFSLDLTKIFEEFVLVPNKTPRLSVVPPGAEDKNRFANVLPIPDTRVELNTRPGDAVSNFINANFVTGYGDQKKRYIATQAPLEGTLEDLWRMVWEQRCPAIVMLVNIVEDGHVKFPPYFPESVGPESSVTYGEFCVTMTRRDVHQEYITSWLELLSKKTGERRGLRHFWLTCWPASGRVEPISLVRFVLDIRPAYQDVPEPLLVHCSTGTGRTGTLLALDVCMRQFEERRCVDVIGCLHDLRQERAGCVQTNQQYALLYSALQEYVTIVSSPGISAASSATTLHAMLP